MSTIVYRATHTIDQVKGRSQWAVDVSDLNDDVDLAAAGYLVGAASYGMKVGDLIEMRSTVDGAVALRSCLFIPPSGNGTPTRLKGAIASTSLASGSSNNDYDPTLGGGSLFRCGEWDVQLAVGAVAGATVTGITGGTDGEVLWVQNIGLTFSVTFSAQSLASLAANRLTSGFVLAPGQSQLIAYSAGSINRWAPIPSIA